MTYVCDPTPQYNFRLFSTILDPSVTTVAESYEWTEQLHHATTYLSRNCSNAALPAFATVPSNCTAQFVELRTQLRHRQHFISTRTLSVQNPSTCVCNSVTDGTPSVRQDIIFLTTTCIHKAATIEDDNREARGEATACCEDTNACCCAV